MDYYDFLQSSDQRKWGLAQKRLALSQCQGNNNWADRDENQGGGGENTSGCFKLTVEFSMLFVQSFPSPPTKTGTSLKLANFLWSHHHDASHCLRPRFLIFHQVWKIQQPTDFLSFLWLKSLGNSLWPIVTPRGWRDNRQSLKMFCAAVSFVSDCYVEWKF